MSSSNSAPIKSDTLSHFSLLSLICYILSYQATKPYAIGTPAIIALCLLCQSVFLSISIHICCVSHNTTKQPSPFHLSQDKSDKTVYYKLIAVDIRLSSCKQSFNKLFFQARLFFLADFTKQLINSPTQFAHSLMVPYLLTRPN